MKLLKITPVNLFLLLALCFLAGFISGVYTVPERLVAHEVTRYVPLNVTAEGHRVEMLIPAVDSAGNGVAGRLLTTVRPGTGLVLVSINDVLAQYDTQFSGRIAAKAAASYANITLDEWDIVYTIDVNATAIEGPSAGAAMAVSIVAALQNRTLDPSVSITGIINEDGTITGAGSVLEKAKAIRKNGVSVFLVGPGQGSEPAPVREKTCETRNAIEYCKVDYAQKKTSLGERLDMTIAEVTNLEEAVGYFLD
ncbi:MAG: hypothetical protein HYY37_04750 [Candidatus Aenigmarchaeota archaeon]|nr:hypothetical protein [Candidatus Aenigmarchaeota archaeon]